MTSQKTTCVRLHSILTHFWSYFSISVKKKALEPLKMTNLPALKINFGVNFECNYNYYYFYSSLYAPWHTQMGEYLWGSIVWPIIGHNVFSLFYSSYCNIKNDIYNNIYLYTYREPINLHTSLAQLLLCLPQILLCTLQLPECFSVCVWWEGRGMSKYFPTHKKGSQDKWDC